jgi:hypothetical protein
MSVKRVCTTTLTSGVKKATSLSARVKKAIQQLRRSNDLHAQPSAKVNPPPPVGHRVDPAVFIPRRVFFMKR